jgi:hypothetical protein
MNTAVIIEPRKHKALPFVLKNFLENLSDEWNMIIFHGNSNKDYINAIINRGLLQHKSRITLVNLNIDNLTKDEYSKLLITNRDFYDIIPTETFLIFQADSMIFSRYKNLINYFLKYDYVGAPWSYEPRNNGHNVGNGGLSLRKKSKMLEIMDKEPDTNLPEDVFFSCTNEVELYKPSLEEAKHFSVENIFSKRTFGCHQPWILKNELVRYFPEVKRLMWLNDKLPQNYFQRVMRNNRIPIYKRNPPSFLKSNISRFAANNRNIRIIPRLAIPQTHRPNLGMRSFR